MRELRTCGFCERMLEEDEELVPVYIGDPPEPRPVRTKATAPKQRERVGYKKTVGNALSQSDPLASDVEVLGLPADELAALIQALKETEEFQFETSPSVHEPVPISEDPTDLPMDPDHGRNDDKVGAEITAKPRPTGQNPDFLVCEFCEESLSKE